MNAQILIDSIVRQVTVLIAQLATSGGIRAPLSHVANQVFVDLARELEEQGVSRKVSADMFGMALRAYIRDVSPILVGVALVWLTLLALLAWQGVNGLRIASYANNLVLYLSSLLFFVVFLVGRQMIRDKPASPIAYLLDLATQPGWQHRFARGAPMLLALVVFMPAFSAMKSAIPLFHDYNWDTVWVEADRAIHGTDPWMLLQPVLGWPPLTSAR